MPEGSHRKPRLRRLALRAVVFLLLGAIVNVAVAYIFGHWIGDSWSEERRPTALDVQWGAQAGLRPDQVCLMLHSGNPGLTHMTLFREPLEVYYSLAQPAVSRIEWGYPCRSITGEFREHLDKSIRSWTAIGGVVTPSWKFIPLTPIWPGFAINTLSYAAILWLFFAVPGTVLRWRRVKRGLCAKCAYPVGTSDFCTECGAPLRGIRQRAAPPLA